jgi:hypothetical protein
MNMDRRNMLKILPAVAGGAVAASAHLPASAATLRLAPSGQDSYKPLQEVTLRGVQTGTFLVTDGAGNPYVRGKGRDPFEFKIGGALGVHSATALDPLGAPIGSISFRVDCRTEVNDEGGEFRDLLADVLWTIMDWNQESPVNVLRYKDRVYQLFANWVFDHTLTMKGMKYFWPDLKDAVDFFAETQREDGMIWENCYPATPEANYFDWKFGYDNFVRRIEGGFRQLRRAPVESHVEQHYLEALYYTWKATGDNEWMKAKLDGAIKAVRYATSDPYRWSGKYQLMHRGFTIDTWDYVSDDQQKFGGTVFVVYLGKSEFGVFYGDNTNLIIGCRRLAEMLSHAGREPEAREFLALADTLQERLDKLAWNGQFYTHWIAENPDYHPDVGVDMSKQVSLSNAYSLNRGISHEKCVAIIRTYQRIRREMPSSSPGEFYGIYPPFQKDFTQNQPGEVWEYCNGGVLSIVAGELAHGAFEHGFEEYAVDILRREKAVADRYRGYLPATLRGKGVETPRRNFQKLDMRSIANADFGAGAPGVPAWVGQPGARARGEAPLVQDLTGMPTGAQELQGIPFDVIDPASNGRRACLGLAREAGYTRSAMLPVHARASSIYLLHAAAGHDHTIGTLTVHYADGSSYSEYIEDGKNVGSWWEPHDSKYDQQGPRIDDTLRVAWHGSSRGLVEVGVYAVGFNNPHPDSELASLEFEAGLGNSKWMVLAATLSDAPVFFAPYDDVSTGIPDGWSAAVMYALVEGLAGVKDNGVAFSRTLLAPRWEAAGVNAAEVTIRYPASGGYCCYQYHRDVESKRVTVDFAGSGSEFELHVLLPKGFEVGSSRLDGRSIEVIGRKVEQSEYALVHVGQRGAHHLELDLA